MASFIEHRQHRRVDFPPQHLHYLLFDFVFKMASVALSRCWEELVVRNSVRLSLSILLILLSLPFLAVSFLVAALCATLASALPRFHHQHIGSMGSVKLRTVDQFGFETP